MRLPLPHRIATIVITGALLGAACSASASEAAEPTTTTSKAPTTTSTTEPLTVEEQVEQAYLASWDDYATAMGERETEHLSATHAGRALELVESEVADLKRDGHAADIDVEHNYAITIVDESTAVVVDEYVNHMILIDPDTGEPREADPNNTVLYVFTLELMEGAWKLTDILRP